MTVGIIIAATWPAHTLASTSTFDLQSAIDACAPGGTVTIPAGTFTIPSQVWLKSGVSLKGAGIDQTVLYMAARSETGAILNGQNVSNVAISDLTLSSDAATGNVLACQLSSSINCTVERVKSVNCLYALKIDSPGGSNVKVTDLTARGCGMMYVADMTGGVFTNIDLQMTQQGLDAYWHCLYVCSNNHTLRFNNLKAQGSPGYAVQLWTVDGWNDPSDDIVFDGLYTVGRPLAISSGFSNITFKNLTAVSTQDGYACIRISDPHNITIDGFKASGGPWLLNRYDGYTTHDITLENGSYTGSNAVAENGSWITNLVVKNVALNGSGGETTTTTAALTTTTTLAPTTTTTLAPTTTTTAAPTTTTTAAPNVAIDPAGGEVTITAPEAGATVPAGAVTIRASVTSSSKIGSVRFFVDGRKVGADLAAPFSCRWTTGSFASGTIHTITAVAYSKSGSEIGSADCSITIAARGTTSTSSTSHTVTSTNTWGNIWRR